VQLIPPSKRRFSGTVNPSMIYDNRTSSQPSKHENDKLHVYKIAERAVCQNIFSPVYSDFCYYEDPADEHRTTGSLLPLWHITIPNNKIPISDMEWSSQHPDLLSIAYGSCKGVFLLLDPNGPKTTSDRSRLDPDWTHQREYALNNQNVGGLAIVHGFSCFFHGEIALKSKKVSQGDIFNCLILARIGGFKYFSLYKTKTLSGFNVKTTILNSTFSVAEEFTDADKAGAVALFSLKNPLFPEYLRHTEVPVFTVCLHPQHNSLMAVGFEDGHVAVFDCTLRDTTPQYISDLQSKHSRAVYSASARYLKLIRQGPCTKKDIFSSF